MKCKRHPVEEAVAVCSVCKSGVCSTCASATSDAKPYFGTLCPDCYQQLCHERIDEVNNENGTVKKKAITSLLLYLIGIFVIITGLITATIQMVIVGILFCSITGVISGWKRADEEQDQYDKKHGASYTMDSKGRITKDENWVGRIIYVLFAMVVGVIVTPVKIIVSFKKLN